MGQFLQYAGWSQPITAPGWPGL